MFSPTSFPTTAWRVTKALNVLPVEIVHPGDWPRIFFEANYTGHYAEHLFASRADAVEHAQMLLAKDEARVARAIGRHARRRAMVKRLTVGGSGTTK